MFYKLFVFTLLDCDESPDDGLPIVFTSKAQVESKEHIDTGSYRYLLLSLISLSYIIYLCQTLVVFLSALDKVQ